MQRQNFKNVRLIIGEPIYEMRVALKSACCAMGFERGNIQDTDKLSTVRDAIAEGRTDLLACNTQLLDGDFDGLIQQIRHGAVGTNPFVNIISLISMADSRTITKSMNSGTDAILVKPISPRQFIERVENMIHERKPFVVTTDYIGPDRRKGHRPGTQEIPRFEVPNPLKAKIAEKPDEGLLRAKIEAMVKVLNEQKIERHAYQVVYLVERIIPNYAEGKIDDGVISHLDRLRSVSKDLSRRVKGSRFANWDKDCRSLVNVVTRIGEASATPDPKDLGILQNLAEVLKFQFQPAERVATAAG
jgi:DNA-binding response OmpR family regulator